jgi:hypothetical protein
MESKDTPPATPPHSPIKRKRGRPRKPKPPKANRPLNSYQQFFREMYPTAEVQALSVRERVRHIAAQWTKHKAETK